MPELRSGVRKDRAHRKPNVIRIEDDEKVTAVRTRPRRRGKVVLDGGEEDVLRGLVLKDTSFEEEDTKVLGVVGVGGGGPVVREEVAEKEMDECDSGGRSGDKGVGADDEGSTAPLPEKVGEWLSLFVSFFFFGKRKTRNLELHTAFASFLIRKLREKGKTS